MRRSSRSLATSALALALAFSPAASRAASPAPHPPSLSGQFKEPLHAVVTVEVNAKGQVIRVRSISKSSSGAWNTNVYSNAQQMFIRRPDGSSVAGVYDVTYDYDPKAPKDADVSRKVSLVQAGGVDPDAPGWVDKVKAEEAARAAAAAKAKPRPTASK